MSELRSLIRASKNTKKELIAATVRMPKELHSFVDELSEHLSLSKQEVLLKLIEEGASIAQDELDPKLGVTDKDQESCSFHILNTNKKHSIDAHEMMVKDGTAAAFYDPWKYNINRIKDGDSVFLYENGVGIVAYGKGTGETFIKDYEGNNDECHYQNLKDFCLLSVPITASEIKKILNRNVVFLRTMSSIPDGQKLLERVI